MHFGVIFTFARGLLKEDRNNDDQNQLVSLIQTECQLDGSSSCEIQRERIKFRVGLLGGKH